MRITLVVWAAILLGTAGWAEPVAGPVTLFDFESGVAGWSGNPWGGGKCAPALSSQAKFGHGALQATYEEIKQGGNVISPYFPDDAPWRSGDYDSVCLWLRGDGSDKYLNLHLECGDKDKPYVYTARMPLDSTKWRRVCLKFDIFWNRQHRPFELATFRRLYFGVTGSHQVLIDQIALQPTLRQVPLEAAGNGGPAALCPALYADRDGRYLLTFDPQAVLEPTVTADVTVTWPGHKGTTLLKTFAAAAATEEVWIPLPGMPDAAGQGALAIKLAEQPGNLCYSGQFSFPVALDAVCLLPTELQPVPRPKDITYHPGSFALPRRLEAHVLSQPDIAAVAVKKLQEELGRCYGRELVSRPEKLYKNDVAFVVITAPDDQPLIADEVQGKLKALREQGYVLHVDGDRIVLAAKDAAGMRYAAITLLQMIASVSPSAAEARAPQLTAADWPSCQWRAINIGLPTTRWGYPNDSPVPVAYFIDYLRRMVVDQKFNMVGLELAQGMKYDRHPEIAGPAAYTKDEVRQIVTFLKRNGVEVFPLIEALGHANWLVIPHPELREDGDEHTLCTRDPATRQILKDCFEEAIAVCNPKYFHFGLDEIRWVTDEVPAEKRCPRCLGADKRALFVEQVKWLHDFAAASNLQMMMWADMVLPEHNGGQPFNLAQTLDQLPKDIVMCDWSPTLAPLSLWDLQRRGFPVLKSNSTGVNNAQLPCVVGNMWGVWAKTPWLTEANWSIGEFCYLPQLVAAEYSWNVYPDLLADAVPVLPKFFNDRPLLQKRLATPPDPAGGRTVTAVQPGPQTLVVAGLKLQPFAEPVSGEKTLTLGGTASSAYLLLTADLPEAERAKFLDEFKKKENWHGVPIGEIAFHYADGTVEKQPLLYGTHVRAVSLAEPFPQALEALGTAPVGQRVGYLVQWVNPHPQTPLASVTFAPGSLAARPLLLGLSTRSVWGIE